MDVIEEQGDLRVGLVPDEDYGHIRDWTDYVPYLVYDADPYSVRGVSGISADERTCGPLRYDWLHFLRVAAYKDEPFDYAARCFSLYVALHGGVSEVRGRRVFYLLPDESDPLDVEQLRRQLVSGADEYERWENGEVYAYCVQRRITWRRVTDEYRLPLEREQWEVVNSCGGFIGYEDAAEAAREALAEVAADNLLAAA